MSSLPFSLKLLYARAQPRNVTFWICGSFADDIAGVEGQLDGGNWSRTIARDTTTIRVLVIQSFHVHVTLEVVERVERGLDKYG